jgi:hypothetical protein
MAAMELLQFLAAFALVVVCALFIGRPSVQSIYGRWRR